MHNAERRDKAMTFSFCTLGTITVEKMDVFERTSWSRKVQPPASSSLRFFVVSTSRSMYFSLKIPPTNKRPGCPIVKRGK